MVQPKAPQLPQNKSYDRTSYILVVDDDETLLKFFKIHLNKYFSRVIVVDNAKDALKTLGQKDIDLVISDIRMPKMDGLQLLKKIRKHSPAIPVFLISGALLDEEQEALVRESDGFLAKPFGINELHEFISKGLVFREKLKELSALMKDPKKLHDVLRGEQGPQIIKEDEVRKKTEDLLAALRNARAHAA